MYPINQECKGIFQLPTGLVPAQRYLSRCLPIRIASHSWLETAGVVDSLALGY